MSASAPTPVAVIIGQLHLGGSERQLYLFLGACDRTRWTPYVFASGCDGQWADAIRKLGIDVELLEGPPLRKLIAVRRRSAQIGARAFVSWSSYTNAYAWSLIGLGIPAVGSYRNATFADLPARLRRVWAWAGAARLHALVANSAETASALRAWSPRPVLLVPNAVEQPNACRAKREAWRQRLGVGDHEPLVMGIGRLSPQKNFHRFVDAVAIAARSVPSLRAVVLGPDYDGMRTGLESYVGAKEVPDGVIAFPGPVLSAAEAVCAADMLLLTSDYEGAPNVVLEAMAAGVPCVTTQVNGVDSVLQDGVSGFIVPHDAEALAEAVVRLARDPALRHEMGDRGRRRMAVGFEPSRVYAQLWEALPVAPAHRLRDRVLRALDLMLCAAAAIPATLPVAVAALLVKLDSPGPAFHRARRVGREGEIFEILKLRSMRVGATSDGPGITAGDDLRVTRLGRLLRRSKLDELPQLVNVARGQMSLVGPRPEDLRYVDPTSALQRTVLAVRPGMTSPASLRYRREEDVLGGDDWERAYIERLLPDKLAIDAAFVTSLTVRSYLSVLLRTVWDLLPMPWMCGHRREVMNRGVT